MAKNNLTASFQKRGSRFLDLTGQKYSRLLVTKEVESASRLTMWECLCDCGQKLIVTTAKLRNGHTKSCGCLRSELRRERIVHGFARKGAIIPEYRTWAGILTRCYNTKEKCYPNYGGRGIKVCDEWRTDFEAFYRHVGPKPSKAHSIDRIDNEKDYMPGNVRWVTNSVQANNKRKNILLTYKDQTLTVSQWSAVLGLSSSTVLYRIHANWCVNCALSIPVNKSRKGHFPQICTHKPSK